MLGQLKDYTNTDMILVGNKKTKPTTAETLQNKKTNRKSYQTYYPHRCMIININGINLEFTK